MGQTNISHRFFKLYTCRVFEKKKTKKLNLESSSGSTH